jgi:hypothetical protein
MAAAAHRASVCGAAESAAKARNAQTADSTEATELDMNSDRIRNVSVRRLAGAVSAIAMLCVAAAAAPAHADEPLTDWQFRGSLYAYAPDISANAVLSGGLVPIRVSAGDIIRRTDLALMGVFEARRNPFGAFADVVALDLSESKAERKSLSLGGGISLPPGVTVDTALTIRMRAMTLAGEWQALDAPTAGIELFAGARLLDMTTRLRYSFNADFGPFSGRARQDAQEEAVKNWDGLVGAKGRFSLGEQHKTFVFVYADAGTGDSRLTWQGSATVGRRFGHIDVGAGWRHVAYQFRSGMPINRLSFDGPLVDASITW